MTVIRIRNWVYEDIGIVRDKPMNLVVTVASGDYTTTVPQRNGNINLMTEQQNPTSGEGTFEFCFHDKEIVQHYVHCCVYHCSPILYEYSKEEQFAHQYHLS